MAPRKRLFVLNTPRCLRVDPDLACEIGLNESLIFLQIEFLISISKNFRDGHYWTYDSCRSLQRKFFPFLSTSTINRTLNSLVKQELIVVGNYNQDPRDVTQWYRINWPQIVKLKSLRTGEDVDPSWLGESGASQSGTGVSQDETGASHFETRISQTAANLSQDETAPSQVGTTLPEISLDTESNNISIYDDALFKELKALGVAPEKRILEILEQHSHQKIKDQLLILRAQEAPPRNPAGWLVSALAGEGYSKPPKILRRETHSKKIEEEQKKLRGEVQAFEERKQRLIRLKELLGEAVLTTRRLELEKELRETYDGPQVSLKPLVEARLESWLLQLEL